jgi:trypsin
MRLRARAFAPMKIHLLLLLTIIAGCGGSKPVVPPLSEQDREQLTTVPKPSGTPAIGNKHAAMLFEAQTKLRTTLVGGVPASSFPELRSVGEQRERQLANAVQEIPDGRIVNGRAVASSNMANLFKYQVALVYTSFPDVPDGQFCAGALIDQDWILTAAHCVRTLQAKDLQVYVGSYSLSGGGHLIELVDNGVIKDEQYNDSDKYPVNDVALLKLKTPLTNISPISLVTDASPSNFYETNNALISGWGDTAQGSGKGSDDLLYAPVQMMPTGDCKAAYGDKIVDGMMCATAHNTDSCQGDSGGPLTVFGKDKKLYVKGIVSWGIGCAQPKFPGVYASIDTYSDWIGKHKK